MNNKIYIKHVPIKKLGQNFLKSKFIINQIIKKIHLRDNDHIIEIGPGFGALTFPVCKIVNNIVTVLEIDSRIAFFLSNSKFQKRLNIVLIDAMKFNFQYFFLKKKNLLYRLIGNLPYGISTCFFLYIIRCYQNISDMHFMFQKEVAQRLLATPGTKEYGRLSVIAQYFYYITPIMQVNKYEFFPVPKVDSIFLRFVPYKKHNCHEVLLYLSTLQFITRKAFQHRRKFLHKNLSILFSKKELLQLKIDPFLRAENISVHQYYVLAEFFLKR